MLMKTDWRSCAWGAGGLVALGVVVLVLRIFESQTEGWWIVPALLIAFGITVAILTVSL
jgi:hypothetical protein